MKIRISFICLLFFFFFFGEMSAKVIKNKIKIEKRKLYNKNNNSNNNGKMLFCCYVTSACEKSAPVICIHKLHTCTQLLTAFTHPRLWIALHSFVYFS